METKRYNVFHELILSFYKFKGYEAFTKNKGGKTFLFGLILAIIQYLAFLITVTAALNTVFNTASEYINKSFPDFLIEDGTLYMNEVIEKKFDDVYVYINTNENFYLDDLTYFNNNSYESVALIDSEKMLILNNGKMQQLDFADLSEISNPITKDKIIETMPAIKNIILLFCTLSIIIFIGLIFWSALWHSLFLLIINAATNARLTFGDLYKISLHICTIHIALIIIIGKLPVTIPYFSLIKFIIFMVYGFFAIKAVKQERELAALGGTDSGEYGGDFSQPQEYNLLNNNQNPNYFSQQDTPYTQGAQEQQNSPYTQQDFNHQQNNPYNPQDNNPYAEPQQNDRPQYDNQINTFKNKDNKQ